MTKFNLCLVHDKKWLCSFLCIQNWSRPWGIYMPFRFIQETKQLFSDYYTRGYFSRTSRLVLRGKLFPQFDRQHLNFMFSILPWLSFHSLQSFMSQMSSMLGVEVLSSLVTVLSSYVVHSHFMISYHDTPS